MPYADPRGPSAGGQVSASGSQLSTSGSQLSSSAGLKIKKRSDGTDLIGAKWKYYEKTNSGDLAAGIERILKFARSPGEHQADFFGVRTAGRQLDMSKSGYLYYLAEPFVHHAYRLLALEGVDSNEMHVMARKLLILEPGEGPQQPHFDQQLKRDAKKKYGVMVYLTKGSGTVVWDSDPAIEDALFLDTPSGYASEAEKAFAQANCTPKRFLTPEVDVGDSMIARADSLHHGPRNTTQHQRIAFYILLSPDRKDRQQDAQQRLPLCYQDMKKA